MVNLQVDLLSRKQSGYIHAAFRSKKSFSLRNLEIAHLIWMRFITYENKKEGYNFEIYRL